MAELNRRDVMSLMSGAIAVPWLADVVRGDSNSPPIKVGQIGVGHAHASKLSVYRDSPDYEVVGIVEANDALRNEAKSRDPYQGLTWMTQEQLLNEPGLQVVLVETEVCDLLDVAEVCIAAGKHIHLDKPAGESLPQFERILKDAERQSLMVQMGYMYRYNPAVVLMRELLRRDWLGAPFEVHTVMSKVVSPGGRQEIAPYPGGIMFELGCHILDLTIGVLGEPERVTPYARQVVKTDQVVDNMLAVLEYPDALATVKSSGVEVEGFDRRHFVVCGTEGTFHIQPLDDPAVRVAFSKPRGEYSDEYQDIRFPEYTRYIDDAADMARVIRGEKDNDFSYDHDRIVQATVLKASGLSLT